MKDMTEEQKEILLTDLSARLPYGVKGNYQNSDDELLKKVTIMYKYLEPNGMVMTGDIKPYLFPLSSMTDAQKEEYESLCIKETSEYSDLYGIIFAKDHYYDTIESIDYLYKNHIDVRGLIPMGLAIDATGLNIY